MKMKWIAVVGVLLLASQVGAGDMQALKTQTDKDNYSIGVDIVRKLKQQGGVINLDLVIQGMKDEITGEQLLVSEDDIQNATVAQVETLLKHYQDPTEHVERNADVADQMTLEKATANDVSTEK